MSDGPITLPRAVIGALLAAAYAVYGPTQISLLERGWEGANIIDPPIWDLALAINTAEQAMLGPKEGETDA